MLLFAVMDVQHVIKLFLNNVGDLNSDHNSMNCDPNSDSALSPIISLSSVPENVI